MNLQPPRQEYCAIPIKLLVILQISIGTNHIYTSFLLIQCKARSRPQSSAYITHRNRVNIKEKSAACFTHRNSVNIKKSSFGAAGAGNRTHDPALQKFFTHHYSIRLFVNIFGIAVFLYNAQ